MTIGDKRITRKTASGEKLIFYPQGTGETVRLQEKLLSMGFVWGDGTAEVSRVEQCEKGGLVLDNGRIYYNTPGNTARYEVCRIDQVGEGAESAPVPRDSVLEMFSRIAARLDAIEARLASLESPPLLDKPVLKSPEPKPGGAP
jgi:hypothetical protein